MTFIVSEGELRCLEDNNLCADCNTGSPTHCDVEHGVLICGQCALAHKSMGDGTHEVKILDDDLLSQEDILSVLERGGNRQMNNELEKCLPSSYRKSLAQLSTFVRCQYIRKKYAKRGFTMEEDTNAFRESRRVGILSKKSELSENEWHPQYVVLDIKKQVLECLVKGGAFQPEDVIPLASAEVFIEKLGEEEGREHCLRISWEKEKPSKKSSSRGASPNGEYQSGSPHSVKMSSSVRWKDRMIKQIFLTCWQEEEIFDWYCCILTAQGAVPRVQKVIHIPIPQPLRLAKSRSTPTFESRFPALRATVGVCAAPQFLKTGKLWKAGPEKLDSWRERWFTLHDSHMVYSRSKYSPYASGDLVIGATVDGYRVERGHAKHSRSPPNEFTFTLLTPWRNYYLCTESTEERDEWMELINRVIHYNNSTMMLRARDFNVERASAVEYGLRKSNSVNNVNSV